MSIAPHSGHDSQVALDGPPGVDQNLQGVSVDATDAIALRNAINLALHYRGDVTITRRNGESLEGYVFDCKSPRNGRPEEMTIRVIPTGRDERVAVTFTDITRLTFSGKDTASGKSFETWVRKYVEKKMAGESASIESEVLD